MADQLLNTLLSSRRVFWEENKLRPETEIQELWDRRMAYLTAELGANLATATPSSVPSKRPVPLANSSTDRRAEKRRNLTFKVPPTQPIQRQVSAPANTAMRRSPSANANQPQSDSASSRYKHSPSRPINIPTTRLSAHWPITDSSCPAYTSRSLPPPQHSVPMSRPDPGFDGLQDLSPADYLSNPDQWSRSPDDCAMPALSVTPSPITTRGEFQPQIVSRLSVSTASGSVCAPFSTSTSVSDPGMTTASTTTSERMSRTTTNDMLTGPFDMCHIGSEACLGGTCEPTAGLTNCSTPNVDLPFSVALDDFAGAPDVSLSPSFSGRSFSYNVSPASVDMFPSLSQQSNGSSSSSDSAQSRRKRRVLEQNHQSKRPLAPKRGRSRSPTVAPATNIVEIVGSDGTTQKKAQIPRANRPAKETTKVFCPICNEHKEGFHGEHELRRHIDRTHNDVRKVFVCKDISPGRTFLASCKHCRNQKTYGANYNAAAHLRRVHFNPCETPKGGRGKVSQNRGGIGGGDQPPMDVLRNWMMETWETNLNGIMLVGSQMENTSFASSTQASSADFSDVQISEADLAFVQNTTHLDMSFLRNANDATFDASSTQASSADLSDVQISEADLALVQNTTHLDMSFLPNANDATFDASLEVSPTGHDFCLPFPQDALFFDTDVAN